MIELDSERLRWYENDRFELINMDKLYIIKIEDDDTNEHMCLIVGYTIDNKRVILDRESNNDDALNRLENLRCLLNRIKMD
jgi:hypothetical protein